MNYWLFLLPLLAGGGENKESWFTGSPAFGELRRSGREVAAEKMLDLDGDGRLDALVAESSEEGIGLSVWKTDEKGAFTLLGRLEPCPGEELARFEVIEFVPGRRVLWLEVVEESPDEADHCLLLAVFEPAPRPVLKDGFRVTHSEQDAGRAPRRHLSLGPERLGLEMMEGGGWPRLRLRHRPKVVALQGANEPLWVTIGLAEKLYFWDGRRYRLEGERYLDFLPALAPEKLEGPAAAAADGDLATDWCPSREEKARLQLRLGDSRQISAVRLAAAAAEADIEKVVLRADKQSEISVSLSGAPADERVAGVGEFALPAAPGRQWIVLLERPIKTESLEVEVAARQDAAVSAHPCLSEISLHRPLEADEFSFRPEPATRP